MNRKTSEIARILEVEPGQLKSWAFMFKDYLGAQANPRKGAPRTFSDSDVLVLAYVWWNWDTEPDLDSIRAGLNSGDQSKG